jgi:predicted esterase
MQNPHESQPVVEAGTPLQQAKTALILIHGRGATAHSMLGLAQEVNQQQMAYLAPQAMMNTWYPQRFIVPRSANEPWLSSALQKVHATVQMAHDAGIAYDHIALVGFSQGACLVAEYVARHPQRYGAVAVLSGGLIGQDDELTDYTGDLAQTPIFLGCSDVDFHIPVERVHASEKILRQMGAEVDKRIYPNMGHTLNNDELDALRQMLTNIVQKV